MTTTEPTGPLHGFLVVDFTHAVAGPLASMLLADLGARVIKVEPPAGDGARRLGRPDADRYLGLFETYNRGKESVVLDLREDAGRAAARRLVDRADVLVQAFRPGVMDRLGLGPDEARARNPRLVYTSVSGYGPDEDRRGVDTALQGETGWMSITGEPRPGARPGQARPRHGRRAAEPRAGRLVPHRTVRRSPGHPRRPEASQVPPA